MFGYHVSIEQDGSSVCHLYGASIRFGYRRTHDWPHMGIVRVTSASPFSGRVHGVKDQRVGVFKKRNLPKFTGIIHLA